jgi:nucleoside-diphosphate-sugar epimerase
MRILIIGDGWIGNRLKDHFKAFIIRKKIINLADFNYSISLIKPDVLINCAGHTDLNDGDIDSTLFSNSFVPLIAAEAAIKNNIKFVHLSSGCLFTTTDFPITEDYIPNFFDLPYTRSKIYSESALASMAEKYGFLILRIRLPLDNKPHPRNILTKLIKYKKVIDEPNSITYIPDFINSIEYLLRHNKSGVFNVVNDGTLRYPQLLDVYKRFKPEFEYEVIKIEDFGVNRPNLILSNEKLCLESKWTARDINSVLEECVEEYIKGE